MPYFNRNESWLQKAACKDYPTEIFFIEGHNSNLVLQAKLICMSCPVRMECLDVGMSEHYGVYGGTSVLDRNRLRRGHKYGGFKRFYEILDRIDVRTTLRAKQKKITKPRPEDFPPHIKP